MQTLFKSPMNYIGNKYRLLPQMLEIFPAETDTFLDLFCGGLDVSVNVNARRIYANDINCYLIGIYNAFVSQKKQETINYLVTQEQKYALSKTNAEGYLALRQAYNDSDRNPLDLFLLMNYAFNYQIRFNSAHEFNTPFGKDRSSWNDSLKARLPEFIDRIKHVKFSSLDFREVRIKGVTFIYADPAYSLSIGSYNDGKRGFKGWSLKDDIDLMDYLDAADRKGVKFALSDVLEHRGQVHREMCKWAEKYHIHDMNCDYNNCNYHIKDKESVTREVLITNF